MRKGVRVVNTILKIMVIVWLGAFILGPSIAYATTATPVEGTVTSFLESCGSTSYPEGCFVRMELDLNISENPVWVEDKIPFDTFTSSNGSSHWEGAGTWYFSNGTLAETTSGVWGKNSIGNDPADNVQVFYEITGGTGDFENAQGSIHIRLRQESLTSAEGRVKGVIRLP